MKEIWFFDLHKAVRPEPVNQLLNGKYGWHCSNVGPLVAFPPNRVFLPQFTHTLPAGKSVAIPWTQQRLHKQVDLGRKVIRGKVQAAKEGIKRIKASQKEIDEAAQTLDAIAAVCTLMVGLGSLSHSTYKVMSGSKKTAEIVNGMRTAGIMGGKGCYDGAKILVGLDPGAYVGRTRAWHQTLLRHGMSLMSPSYWASLAVSAYTGDWDLWKYGTNSITDREIQKRLRILAKETLAKNLEIAAMLRQAEMKFYRFRVHQSRTSYQPPTLPELLNAAQSQ